jgi:outer membrane protein
MKSFASLLFSVLFVWAISSSAVMGQQKIGYADSQYILEQLSDYQAVQKEIESISQQWQKEIEESYEKIDKLYQEYQAKKVLLTKEDNDRMQAEIMDSEKKAKDLQRKRFGVNGELFKMREDKMKPIQEKVSDAIDKYAKENKFDLILDKSGSMVLLYGNSKWDVSKPILQKMGVSPTTAPGTKTKDD